MNPYTAAVAEATRAVERVDEAMNIVRAMG
jgi:hypothetical protein